LLETGNGNNFGFRQIVRQADWNDMGGLRLF